MTVDGVVTVVDARAVVDGQFAHNVAAVDAQRAQDDNLDHETPLSELFEDQIACADMIVVNKIDQLSEDEAAALVADLRKNSRDGGAQWSRPQWGALPIDVLLGQGIGAEDNLADRHEVHHHHHHDDEDDHHHDHAHEHGHDAFQTFAVNMGEITDVTAFTAQISDVIRSHNILRLKGFAAVTGKPMRLTIQAVGPRIDSYFDRPFATGEARGHNACGDRSNRSGSRRHHQGANAMTLIIEVCDPHDPQATALLEASHALMESLFEPGECHFLSIDALCTPDIHFFIAREGDNRIGLCSDCRPIRLRRNQINVRRRGRARQGGSRRLNAPTRGSRPQFWACQN